MLFSPSSLPLVVPTQVLVLVLVLVLASLTIAQTPAQINATAIGTRRAWCTNQVAICRNLCTQSTDQNDCNFNTLKFNCVCGNGTRLDFSESVDLTIPYFICLNYQQQPCVRACPAGDQACNDKCNELYKCGKVKPGDPTVTITATADTPEPTDGTITAGGRIDLNDASTTIFTFSTALIAVIGIAFTALL